MVVKIANIKLESAQRGWALMRTERATRTKLDLTK
jgi:hypothetical protein